MRYAVAPGATPSDNCTTSRSNASAAGKRASSVAGSVTSSFDAGDQDRLLDVTRVVDGEDRGARWNLGRHTAEGGVGDGEGEHVESAVVAHELDQLGVCLTQRLVGLGAGDDARHRLIEVRRRLRCERVECVAAPPRRRWRRPPQRRLPPCRSLRRPERPCQSRRLPWTRHRPSRRPRRCQHSPASSSPLQATSVAAATSVTSRRDR